MKPTRLLSLAPLLVLALTACSSSPSTTTSPPASVTTSATAAPSTTSPATVAPTGAGTQVTTAAVPARAGRCVSSALRASLGQGGAAAGTSFVAVLLTNRGRVTCVLNGYPGVSFVGGTSAHQIGSPALRDNRFAASTVTLVPGATVHATVAVANYLNYDQKACAPVRATGFRIYPPGSTGSLLVSAPQTVCSKPGLQGFRTSVVRPGTSLN